MCWSRLENLVVAEGIEHPSSETSDELTRRLIEAETATANALVRLHTLFVAARFSSQPFGTTERDEARSALADLERALRVDQVLDR